MGEIGSGEGEWRFSQLGRGVLLLLLRSAIVRFALPLGTQHLKIFFDACPEDGSARAVSESWTEKVADRRSDRIHDGARL